MTQPNLQQTKINKLETEIFKRLNKKVRLQNEKFKFIHQEHTSWLKIQIPAQSEKTSDWWEPDTIYVSSIYDFNTRNIFSYENSKCVIDLKQTWENSQWKNYLKYTYSYDTQNNMSEMLEQIWQSNQWVNSSKISNTFNSNNKMATSIFQIWENGKWVNAWKQTYEYDIQNNTTEETGQYWESEQWNNDEKCINFYDENNNLKESIFQNWEDGNWESFIRYFFTYNVQNNMEEFLYQVWEDAQWVDFAVQTFYYNEDNLCTFYIIQFWTGDEWKNDIKIILTYDEQRNRTSELWQDWIFGQWEDAEKSTYFYDDNNNAITGICAYWNGTSWINNDGGLDVFYNNMQSLLFLYGHEFTATYIRPSEIGIKEIGLHKDLIKIFPNPVSNILHIETSNAAMPEVKIYSIQGELVISTRKRQIDVSSLLVGIYIAEIEGTRFKIVKQ